MCHHPIAVVPSPRPSGVEAPVLPARLHLAAPAPAPSHVDGAWWPRSTDLVAELPALLDAVRDRTGNVALVGFHRDAWDRTADDVKIAGETIWLEGFTDDEPHTVIVIGSSGRRLTLMVVAPESSEAAGLEELVGQSHSRPAAGADADVQRWLGRLAARLASMEGPTNERRTRTIERWVREAAVPFIDAPVQAYVPLLVEHIVREQITPSPQPSTSTA